MEHTENKPKVDNNSSLNQDIDRLEKSLNSLSQELQKLKERKKALETPENQASNSISNEHLEINNKRKKGAFLTIEYENTDEIITIKRKKSNNKYVENETVDDVEPTSSNNFDDTSKDKRQRTISDECFEEDTEAKKSKKKKRKHKSKAEGDINETTAKYTENSLENEESNNKKETIPNKIKNLQKINVKERLDIIKKIVDSITEQTTGNGDEKQENYKISTKNVRNLNNKFYNSQNNQSNYISYDKFHYNRFPNQQFVGPSNFSKQSRFENNSVPYNQINTNSSPHKFNNQVQNGRFLNKSEHFQLYSPADKMYLRDKLKSNSVKLNFKGSNISNILGYGQGVRKF